MTGTTNTEEASLGRTSLVPFLVETKLRKVGKAGMTCAAGSARLRGQFGAQGSLCSLHRLYNSAPESLVSPAPLLSRPVLQSQLLVDSQMLQDSMFCAACTMSRALSCTCSTRSNLHSCGGGVGCSTQSTRPSPKICKGLCCP